MRGCGAVRGARCASGAGKPQRNVEHRKTLNQRVSVPLWFTPRPAPREPRPANRAPRSAIREVYVPLLQVQTERLPAEVRDVTHLAADAHMRTLRDGAVSPL